MKTKLGEYRKVIILLPLVAFISFIILYLIADRLKPVSTNKPLADTLSRLNSMLPQPHLKDKATTKLEAFMQLQSDSLKRQKEDESTSSVKRFFDLEPPEDPMVTTRTNYPAPPGMAKREKKVNQQLDKILQELNNPAPEYDTNRRQLLVPPTGERSPEIDRLEQLIATLQSDTTKDPEMQQLDAMLDKIIRIQNPQEANGKRQHPTDSNSFYPVGVRPASIMRNTKRVFFGLEESNVSLSKHKPAIRAVVHEDQTIQDGATIKLRLIENTYIGDQEIPAGTFVYGICNIADERLNISLDRIVIHNSLYPIKLTAYDLDGIPGIHIPGAITRDATKEGLDRTMQTLTMTSLDPSMAAQVTNAGIQSLKTLLSRKIKQVKVTIKSGHQLYLQ